jgi:hypothetical protein
MQIHALTADLVVVGGGLSGVCAALAAARNGARVILVQDRSLLGGNASSEIKMHIVGADCHGTRPGARESGLLEELKLEDAARNPHRSYSQWDLLLYEKVCAEPNITLLLDTACVGCETSERDGQRRIARVRALRSSTEDEFVLTAPWFADCSGDGLLGSRAGADFTVGREAKSTHGESLAVDVADRQTLGSSILFTARQHATPQPFIAPSWIRKFTTEDFRHRPVKGFEYGYWWFEWGGQLDTLKDNAAIRHELLRIALGVWDYVKNSGAHPTSANWALDWVGSIPGKRETRRFVGPHVLTQQDVESGARFADAVAYGGWWLDLHPPSGVDARDEEPCAQHHFPHLYTIPLRCLHSRNVANLFFAGRNISATHVAFASTRVMGTCSVMGQAIGTAAALLAGDRTVESIGAGFAGERIRSLQERLLKDDAFLPGFAGADPRDQARRARLTASSEMESAAAALVVDGVTRPLLTHLGPWADGGEHRWRSRELPAWLELTWDAPREIREIHLTFDTGFERELLLSLSDAHHRKVIRGPQPETVRDYVLEADGVRIAEVSGNYLRKRVHRLVAPITARRLRLVVQATNGVDHARVFEIRVY